MAKKHAKILELEAKTCRLGKISNNLEKHGDEYVTAFTIPVGGLMLTKAELNAFMRDKFCHQSWFDTTKPGAAQPMGWWGDEDFALSQAFEADGVSVELTRGRVLEFEAQPDDEDENEESKRAACELSGITLKPHYGGLTEMRFRLSLRPGMGRENLALQEYQHREVKLTLVDARAKERAERQPQLPMGDGAAPETPDRASDAAATH